MDYDLRRAEARYEEALEDLRRFERRMDRIFVVCATITVMSLLCLVILKVLS